MAGRTNSDSRRASLDHGEIARDTIPTHVEWIRLARGDVSYIDSSGIGELVAAYTLVTKAGGTLKLLGLTKHVQDLLQITKLYTVFEVHEDEAHALRSFA